MKWLPTLILLLVSVESVYATKLCDEVRLAHADCKRILPAERKYWRYLSSYAARDEKEIELLERTVLGFHRASLSTAPKLPPLAIKVGPTLYRFNVLYQGALFSAVYENLHKRNPYFPCFERVQLVPIVPAIERTVIRGGVARKVWVKRPSFVEIDVADVREGETVWEEGTDRVLRQITLPKVDAVSATAQKTVEYDPKQVKVAAFLPAKELQELADMVESKVPLLRTEWFFYRSAISLNRDGDGYLDFMGIKSRKDAIELAGLDAKRVDKLGLDMAGIVIKSGVATNEARQVWWAQAYGSSWWTTYDLNKEATGKRNVARLLGRGLNKLDFQHDAEEVFFHLPNGLWGYGAFDADGTIQKAVPGDVASDDSGTSRDMRVHVGPVSCARCHEEGLRPVKDWAREVYQKRVKGLAQARLASADPKEAIRLEEIYLSDLPGKLEEDNFKFERLLKRVNGFTPKENSQGLKEVWRLYVDTPLGMEDCARELGVKKEIWSKALESHATRVMKEGKVMDPILNSLLQGEKVIRPQWEELYGTAQLILREVSP